MDWGRCLTIPLVPLATWTPVDRAGRSQRLRVGYLRDGKFVAPDIRLASGELVNDRSLVNHRSTCLEVHGTVPENIQVRRSGCPSRCWAMDTSKRFPTQPSWPSAIFGATSSSDASAGWRSRCRFWKRRAKRASGDSAGRRNTGRCSHFPRMPTLTRWASPTSCSRTRLRPRATPSQPQRRRERHREVRGVHASHQSAWTRCGLVVSPRSTGRRSCLSSRGLRRLPCHYLADRRTGYKNQWWEVHLPPALAHKSFHPFTDFLLHDIGTGDGIVQNGGEASRLRMKTPALWGLRIRLAFLHDGRW